MEKEYQDDTQLKQAVDEYIYYCNNDRIKEKSKGLRPVQNPVLWNTPSFLDNLQTADQETFQHSAKKEFPIGINKSISAFLSKNQQLLLSKINPYQTRTWA